MRQFQKVISAVLLVSSIWMSPAYAAKGWFKCEVVLAGISDSNTFRMRLTDLAADPAFEVADFYSGSLKTKHTENSNAFLAIGLTAMYSDLPVWIFAGPDLAVPTFYQFYLAKE